MQELSPVPLRHQHSEVVEVFTAPGGTKPRLIGGEIMGTISKPTSRNPKKPTLFLLPGKETNDVRALAQLFEKVTGRAPSNAELKSAKKKLKRA